MKRIVLTGGPSCGKSSVIEILEEKGFGVMKETATEVLLERGVGGKDVQDEITRRQFEKEKSFGADGLVFMDRSLVDCFVYSEFLFGKITEEFESSDLSGVYDKVFIFDRLPFVKNEVRIESGEEEAQKIHDAIIAFYKKLNYALIRVPALPVEERVEFILSKLN